MDGRTDASVVVDEPALVPDLALAAVRHGQLAELDERVGEVLVPERAVLGVLLDVPQRLPLLEQLPVRVERHDACQVVVVVAVVQKVVRLPQLLQERRERRRHGRRVLVAHVVGNNRVRPRRALTGEQVPVRRHDLVGRRGEPRAEGRAVAHADGVRAGQDDQLLHGEVLAPEVADQLRDGEGGVRQVALRVAGEGDGPVQPPRGGVEVHVPVAQEARRVARRVHHDVRARDRPRALRLHRGLDLVDHVERRQADVDRGRLLRVRVRRGRVQQHGPVAALYVVYIYAYLFSKPCLLENPFSRDLSLSLANY
jgi:hypothetical protein